MAHVDHSASPILFHALETMAQYAIKAAKSGELRQWMDANVEPPSRGWYECRALDDRWDGETRFRAWGQGMWWIPLGGGDAEAGWISSPMGLYEWRGPAHDIDSPMPEIPE